MKCIHAHSPIEILQIANSRLNFSGLMFSIFSATIKDRPSAQAAMSIALVIMILFSGFTVQPDVIPPYYIWIYWMNLFAWVIRAVVINEYQR